MKKIIRVIQIGLLVFCVLFTSLSLVFLGIHYQDITNLLSTWGIVNSAFIESPDRSTLFTGASRGLVEALGDKYSEYVTGEEFAQVQERLGGEFAGIGIYFTMEEDVPLVVFVFPDSPAEQEGLREGDRILVADGTQLAGMDMEEVSDLLKGPEDTRVVLLVEREDGTTEELTLTRAFIQYITIHSQRVDAAPQIGYVHISSFSRRTPEQLEAALDELGEISGLVLDLRHNGGGEVSGALGAAAFFVPEGPIIFEESRYNIRAHESTGGNVEMPLVILVNGSTASSAEIVAGAIQDTGRAPLIGEQTFGKGIVQRYFPTTGGDFVKLTVTRYLTPRKRSIHGEGLRPDIEIPMSDEQYMQAIFGPQGPDPEGDPQLARALELLAGQ